ncbi:MAG: FAD-dependent oxidoreductase [Arenicellales bacterium]|nr:FAD-dependent oxidoreductase [Arenicellales bacterium]
MPTSTHHVVLGNGIAGNHAADVIRKRDPNSRITIISAGALLFYNRYDLPNVFRGQHQWVDYLVHPPEYYESQNITLRRKTRVVELEPQAQTLSLAHRETLHYDKLLIATGGHAYIPARLLDDVGLMHSFHNFRVAMQVQSAVRKNGTVIMLGGDVMGLDLARTIIATGHRVIVALDNRTFWPHEIAQSERARYLQALESMGLDVRDHGKVDHIEAGNSKGPARQVFFEDGSEIRGDVVMPFFGLVPTVDFLATSGIDMERGILVNPQLQTARNNIWAAGDVCQIWSATSNAYRFYYGYRNVKMMGEVAAYNMTGEQSPFESTVDEALEVTSKGLLHSPFWEYDQRG